MAVPILRAHKSPKIPTRGPCTGSANMAEMACGSRSSFLGTGLFFRGRSQASGCESRETTAFDLPYWNWYEDPLPQIFKEGDEKTNPLYVRGSLAGGSVDLDKN